MTEYDNFAWLYYRHWAGYSYTVRPVLSRVLLSALARGGHIIDLCCGTGQTAGYLVSQGFAVTGIDNSPNMLAYAKREAPGAQLLLQDARTFACDHPASAVISLFDSLNHMLTADDLMAVFSRVFATLEPGGKFFFDVNTLQKYQAQWARTDAMIHPDHVAMFHSEFDLRSRLATFNATIFILHDRQWIRSDVVLQQRAYKLSMVAQLLRETGFSAIQIMKGVSLSTDPQFSGRAFFLATKPTNPFNATLRVL
ncbi:MAG: class I SAM-dependent methyltransferase [Sulfobacillus thermotolerans]|nr:class I SAM-dependent methyltransferase [Sulfobacillus thermotolerans]